MMIIVGYILIGMVMAFYAAIEFMKRDINRYGKDSIDDMDYALSAIIGIMAGFFWPITILLFMYVRFAKNLLTRIEDDDDQETM